MDSGCQKLSEKKYGLDNYIVEKGQVGWVWGGFSVSCGSAMVVGEWSVGQRVVGVMGFQKVYGLYG